MLLRISRCLGVMLSGLVLAGVAHAEDVKVTTGAVSAKLGGQFRSELLYSNNGIQSTDAKKADASTTLDVDTANILLDGKYNNDTEFAFRFNLYNPSINNGHVEPIDYGYGTHWFNKMIGWSFGKMMVLQGGFDNIDGDFKSHATGVYAQNLVFNTYEPMTALTVKAGGTFTLQVLNDKVSAGNDGVWNKNKHPTFVLGYRGDFGPVSPLVDIGSYDNNKSRWLDVGVKTEMNGLMATLDYYNNNHANMLEVAGEKPKSAADVSTAITLYAQYEVKGAVTPWLYFSTFDNKQFEDKTLGLSNAKYNDSTPAVAATETTAATPATYSWNDNGQTIGVGVNLNDMGKGWTPYIAFINQSGKFEDEKNPGEAKSKSEMWLRVGVLGEI